MNQKPNPKIPKYFSFTLILLVAALLMLLASTYGGIEPERQYYEMMEDIKQEKVDFVWFVNGSSRVRYQDVAGKKYSVDLPQGSNEILQKELMERNVRVRTEKQNWINNVGSFLPVLLVPAMIFIGLWYLIMRQAQSSGNQAIAFGRSKAKMLTDNAPRVTFEDVAGVNEAKEELEEIVDFLREPKKYQSLGAKIPRGILLVGPPGSGKTLLARAIAGEAKVPFFHMSGSDFVEMFVGVGASRVRDLFEQAKKNAPCLVFVDEIDAVGRQRGAGLGGGHDEREQTLNQLLVEMDGFDPNQGVILIAATNRPDVLDPALLRPGRFDRQVIVDQPDVVGRKQILEVHAKGKPFKDDVDLEVVAKRTPGCTGADLANVLNEAAILAARGNLKQIDMSHIEEAVDRSMAGPRRKSKVMTEKIKQVIAYHEAGHALVAHLLVDADPVHKVTILPRGMALGYTLQLPTEDRYMLGKNEMLDSMTVLLGGRVAEENVFGEITSGASNDLERVTRMARKMVCEYGMSDVLGPLTFGKKHENIFLGRDFGEERNYGEEIAAKIDQEVRHFVDGCYRKAEELLRKHRDRLDTLAALLVRKETLEGEALHAALNGEPIPQEEAPVEEERVAAAAGEDPAKAGAEVKREAEETVRPKAPKPRFANFQGDRKDKDLLLGFAELLEGTLARNYLPGLRAAGIQEAIECCERDGDPSQSADRLERAARAHGESEFAAGFRIKLALLYFDGEKLDKSSEELTKALMLGAGRKVEERVEKLLIAAIRYFRMFNEEIRRNDLSVSALLEKRGLVEKVDERYREWERSVGFTVSSLIPGR